MNEWLRDYLTLEKTLDSTEDATLQDVIRGQMDAIWFKLSADDRAYLDAR